MEPQTAAVGFQSETNNSSRPAISSGLIVAVVAAETETKRARGTGSRSVYESLRNEILSLALPPGQLLDETTLAERFNMSRAPVREALIRLGSDELVVTLSNRSTIVAPIEVATFPKYVEALDIAQRMNTRLAAALRTDADLKVIAKRDKAFAAAVKTGNHLAMSEANKEFHMAIAYAGKNQYLASFYEKLLSQGQRMLHLHFEYLERTHEGYLLTDEHTKMFEAVRDRNIDLADELAHAHTRLHVAAALWHHFIRKDPTLRRMIPYPAGSDKENRAA
ncbi:GntR family transcriptional regulator [Agrobacterium burrii]